MSQEKKSRKTISWSKDDLLFFFELLKQHSCLCDSKHKSYYKKRARADALNNIKEEINIRNIKVEDIRHKLYTIRTQISHELKKINESQKSVSGSSYVYEPVWWFDHAQFLFPHMKQRKEKINLVFEETEEEKILSDQFIEEKELNSIPSTSNIAKIRKTSESIDLIDAKTLETSRVLNENIPKANEEDKNKDNNFVKFITSELREIDDPVILCDLKCEITTAIFKYKKKWLNQKNINN